MSGGGACGKASFPNPTRAEQGRSTGPLLPTHGRRPVLPLRISVLTDNVHYRRRFIFWKGFNWQMIQLRIIF